MFIGQPKIKEILNNIIISAQKRNTSAPHLLFSGKPGYGKNTIAYYVAETLGCNFFHLIGAKTTSKDLCHILIQSVANDIIFIDEIHTLDVKTEEFLYPILEENKVVTEKGSVVIHPLTFIGATTNTGKISRPLISRFPYQLTLQEYTAEEKKELITYSANKIGISILDTAYDLLAESCKDTPRLLHNLIITLRDYCVSHKTIANKEAVTDILSLLEIQDGLDKLDRRYLDLLSNTPMSLNVIAANLGIRPDVVSESIEPYLIERGLITIVSRGRIKKSSDTISEQCGSELETLLSGL